MILAAKPDGTKVTTARARSEPQFRSLERCKGAPYCNAATLANCWKGPCARPSDGHDGPLSCGATGDAPAGASMIGLVLVTHGRLAVEFRSALEHVVGPQTQIEAGANGPHDDGEQRRQDNLEAGQRRRRRGRGAVL